MDESFDVSFISGITEDVPRVLGQIRFFERLDDLYCPQGKEVAPLQCRHDYAQTELVLTEKGMDLLEV